MSNEEKVSLGGLNIKELAFIILMINLSLITAMIVVSFTVAIMQGQTITITGGFNLDQLMVVVIGISAVATVLVAQKLTGQQVTQAIADNDAVWKEEK